MVLISNARGHRSVEMHLYVAKKYYTSDIRRVNSNTVNKRFISAITDELLSEVLVLLELIFIRYGSFEK
jgi:uncharacterized protein (DUF1015 family)